MSNPNFYQHEQRDLLYRISIPTNWSRPAYLDTGQKIVYSTSPDRRQAVYTVAFTGTNFDQFVQDKQNVILSKGGQLISQNQYLWQGQYPARYMVFSNFVIAFIEANNLIYCIAAAGEGVHLIDQTIHSILNSFQIFSSPQGMQLADLQALQSRALQWQQAIETSRIFYDTAMKGIMSINPGWVRVEVP